MYLKMGLAPPFVISRSAAGFYTLTFDRRFRRQSLDLYRITYLNCSHDIIRFPLSANKFVW